MKRFKVFFWYIIMRYAFMICDILARGLGEGAEYYWHITICEWAGAHWWLAKRKLKHG